MQVIDNTYPVPAGFGGDGAPMTNMFGDLVPGEGGSGHGTSGGGRPPSPYPHPAPAPTSHPVPTPVPAPGTPTPAPGATPPAGTPPSALSAWQQFYNSPAYQVPLAEGLKGVNTKYAAMGALESGAAMKAINDYAAGHAASALSTYMDDLYRQEALGASSASALAGVGQNLVGQVTSNNNNASSAAGNAALQAGQASANGWNNTGAAIGTAAGQIAGALGSSYHPATNNALANSGVYPGVPDYLLNG